MPALYKKQCLNQSLAELPVRLLSGLCCAVPFCRNLRTISRASSRSFYTGCCTRVDKIRNGLIDKILSIKNKDFLVALDKLISSISSESEVVELTREQKIMLEMSEQDFKNGKLISQEAMDKRNLEWLNEM